MQRKVLLILAVLLFIIAFFSRFYKLGQIPLGLNKDETAIGYNAYSILKTGKDEYGISNPIYFKSYNDYKLPVYIYMTVVSEKLFGVTQFAIRFPSAVFGLVTIISLFFLVKILSKRLDLAVLSSLFLAFNPWQFFFSRTGFEVNVATAFATLGALLFILGIRHRNNLILIAFSILSFALSVYSYNVARLLAPLLLSSLVSLYRSEIRRMPRIRILLCMLFGFLLALPLIVTLKEGSGLHNQIGGVFLTGTNTKAQQTEIRSYLLNLPSFYSKVFFNSPLLILLDYLRNIVMSFSVDFFFINGAKYVNGVANYGMFHAFEFVTIMIGLYNGIKKRVNFLTFFLIWSALLVILISLTVETPHPTRSFMLVVPLSVFSAYGSILVWEYISGARGRLSKPLLQLLLIIISSYSVIYYFTIYFFMFPANQAKIWRSADQGLITFLTAHEEEYDKIIIDNKLDFSYTALAFYKELSPVTYQSDVRYRKDGLLSTASKLGKYEFTDVNWDSYYSNDRILYVTTADGFTNKPVYKTFYYPERPVSLSVNGTIVVFPHKDTAYVLIRNVK
ncbi:MAG TPA: glycosyltransferase family 39 protein [Candidatus Saccharimonadales bacterium]|nr:glycosyltransferase family 39 protein [Candidatus Saccharimonadales bacterium]